MFNVLETTSKCGLLEVVTEDTCLGEDLQFMRYKAETWTLTLRVVNQFKIIQQA